MLTSVPSKRNNSKKEKKVMKKYVKPFVKYVEFDTTVDMITVVSQKTDWTEDPWSEAINQ